MDVNITFLYFPKCSKVCDMDCEGSSKLSFTKKEDLSRLVSIISLVFLNGVGISKSTL